MGSTEQILSRRGDIVAIVARHGGRAARVIGSVARGESGPESDVDILVQLEPGRTLLDQAAIQLDLEEMLGRRVDVVTERGLRASIRDRVLREALTL